MKQTDFVKFFKKQIYVTNKDIVVIDLVLGNQQQLYIDCFYGSLDIPTSQYSITGILSDVDAATTTLDGLINFSAITNITQSELWKQGYEYLGSANFAPNTLNAMYMVTSFVNNYDVLSLGSYNSSLQFNEYNDVAFGSIGYYIFKDGILLFNSVYAKDPIYGVLNFDRI